MFLQSTFYLTLVLDTEKFNKLFDSVYSILKHVDESKYADYALASKGVIILYYDSQYKKKLKLIVNPCQMLNSDKPDPEKFIRKLEKRVSNYFNHKYQLNDFELSGMELTTDIDVQSQENVSDYLKVLRRIGKVKGFSPSPDNWLDDDISICLDGNSNGIKFMLYNLEALLGEEISEAYFTRMQKSAHDNSEGLLRAEIRLTKPKAIRGYTNKSSISKQIADLHDNRQQIFLDTFMRIVPFGNFYKKNKAEEIIRAKIKDATIGRRMLWLIGLVPEKKSLLLAQKALNYRRIDKVMKAFFDIEVAPITIGKRHDIQKLDNLYEYL